MTYNRITTAIGDEVLAKATRLKIDICEYQGDVEASFELHGDLCCERDDDGEKIGQANLGLLVDLLAKFQRKGDL